MKPSERSPFRPRITGLAAAVVRLLAMVSGAAGCVSAQLANPPQLSYSTYVGPTDIGQAQAGGAALYGLAVDAAGSAYVVGGYSDCTSSALTKLNAAGTAAVWSTCVPIYLATAVAVDAAGDAYVAGYNYGSSPAAATVIKLGPGGQQLLYSTTIAGATAASLALDGSGNAYLLGSANSSFQPTPGAYMTSGGYSAVVKLSASGAVEYATYTDVIFPSGIAVDSKGQVWVVGSACPAGVLGEPQCDYYLFGRRSAIRKLDAAGANLLASMTFGGGGPGLSLPGYSYRDTALAVAVDATDSAWIVGTEEDTLVPVTPNALQPNGPRLPLGNSGGLGYAIKLSSSGGLLYGTYLGSNQPSEPDLYVSTVAVDSQGRPYFALNAPTNTSPQNQPTPAAFMVLSADGSTVLASTNSLHALVQFVAIDSSGGLYAAGTTQNRGFVTTPGSYIPLYPAPQYWASEGFVAKFDFTTQAPAPQFSVLVNGADLVNGYFSSYYGNGTVAPGEIVTIFGSNLPSNPKVTFDGRPAPILYAGSNQINAVVPFEVTAPGTVIEIAGVRGYVLPVWPDVPGLFTANGGGVVTTNANGLNPLAALNQDGTVNSAANPALAGSIVSVFLTGAGAMSPPIADGTLGPLNPPYPVPTIGSSATVSGNEAPISFIGQAPGLIAGCIQVNLQIPASTASGTAALIVYIGNYYTPTGGIFVK